MSADEFRAIIQILWGSTYGEGVAARAADFLDVSTRTVKKWQAGESPVPVGVHEALVEELRGRIFDRAPGSPSASVIQMAIGLEQSAA